MKSASVQGVGFAGSVAMRRGLILLGMTGVFLMTGCKRLGILSDSMEGKEAGEHRSFAVCAGVDVDFRWVPAGEFALDGGKDPDAARIDQGFWIAAEETSVADWRKVMGKAPAMTGTSGKKPVAHVSWYDCREFLKKLKSPASGWKYEVPTELQWEYACHAGVKSACSRYHHGVSRAHTRIGMPGLHSAREQARPWAIEGLQGNVSEWCADSMSPSHAEHAVLGGPGNSYPISRKAEGDRDVPFLRISHVGFRLVLVRDKRAEPVVDPLAFNDRISRKP